MFFIKCLSSCLMVTIMFTMSLPSHLTSHFHAEASSSSSLVQLNTPAEPTPIQILEELEWSSIPTIFSTQDTSQQSNLIQVFDVEQGKVILSVKNSDEFQKEAKKWLSDITSLAPEVQPDMKAKYIARVPLQPAQNVQVGNVQLKAAVVFLFYYKDVNKEPLLLVFDEQNKPFFFHIHENVKPFFEHLGLPH